MMYVDKGVNPTMICGLDWMVLCCSQLQGKKGVWLKLPLERSDLVPVAVQVTCIPNHMTSNL